MADNTDKTTPVVSPYLEAYVRAAAELDEVKDQEKKLAVRRAHLQETMRALWPLVTESSVNINSLSLSNAVRLIFNGLDDGQTVTPIEVRGKLRELGFNLDQFENPMASIHTALNRMLETEELTKPANTEQKKFAAGPELKPVPEPQLPLPPDLENSKK